jgi:hypothetical protein
MSMPVPPAGDQPTYIDPVTGQPLYVDPTTGQLAYTDPAAAPSADPAPTVGYPATGYPGYPGYPPYQGYADPAQAAASAPGYTAPGYPQGAYGAPAYGYPGYPMVAVQNRTNPMSIVSMVLSLVGAALLFCYGVGGVFGVAGAILGHIARKQTKARGEQGEGMALAGIIVGWIVLALGVIIVIGVVYFFVWVTHNSELNNPDPFPS